MASKRRQRKSMCGDKKRYGSYADASADRWPNRFDLQAYGCRFCGGVHLGHPNEAGRRSRVALKINRSKEL